MNMKMNFENLNHVWEETSNLIQASNKNNRSGIAIKI